MITLPSLLQRETVELRAAGRLPMSLSQSNKYLKGQKCVPRGSRGVCRYALACLWRKSGLSCPPGLCCHLQLWVRTKARGVPEEPVAQRTFNTNMWIRATKKKVSEIPGWHFSGMKERMMCDFDCQLFDADKAALVFKIIAFHVNEVGKCS